MFCVKVKETQRRKRLFFSIWMDSGMYDHSGSVYVCVSTCMWSAPGTDISGTNQMAPERRKMPLHGWRLIFLFFELNGCFRRAARV